MTIHRRQSILIVEDVSTDLDLLNHILGDHYTIHVAKTGAAALESAAELQPDLILLDIILPDMTGFAVLSTLKESGATRDIPIIIITGINNVQYEEKGLMLGAVDYITKPFHNTVVLARIKMHLQLIRYVQTIMRLGLIDVQTDLPNRRCFENQLEVEWARAIRQNNPLSLLLLDIDDFPAVQEKYGQVQEENLLRKVASTIVDSSCRPADLAARLEDGRFALLLPNTDQSEAATIAEGVRNQVEKTVVSLLKSTETLSPTASVGVVSKSPSLADTLDDFLSGAHQSVDLAKEKGGNKVVCFDNVE